MVDLSQYFPLSVAAVFVSAVLAVLVAVRRSDDPKVRKSFLALFFVGLLTVNLLPFPPLLPFTHLHKYTESSSNPTAYYEIYVVDANGNELRYDGNAARPAGTLTRFGGGIATEYSDAEAKSTAAYLLDRARRYRQRVRDGRGVRSHVDFPPHALGDRWDGETLARYDDFVGLRVYAVELRYEASGRSIDERDRTLVASLRREGEFIRNGTAR
ncbi:hypothetical protein [Halosimplex halophilum]|uniref:hypothetical protein n=1 Tax=Halosimplex halophilum TaxID=2559572 RepID=UPI00107F15EB|nr:hypothetical protein [Halosimplex halophilum]